MVSVDDNNVHMRSARTTLLLLFILIISFSSVYAQNPRNETPPLRERMFYGGSLGLQFGTITDIDISPIVGLWLLPRLAVAVGPKYRFYKYHDIRTDIYGGRVYSQFVVIQDFNNIVPLGVNVGIFLHAEDELLSLQSKYWKTQDASGRFFVNTVLVGGGISQPMGVRSSLNLMILWPLDDYYNIYGSPEIRVSVIF